MTVKVTKPAINVREKLSELDKETGIKGEELLRADTSAEAREALQLDQQLFTDFESTGIDDNATSTAVTIDSAGNVGIGETNPDGLLHLTGDTNANGAELYLQVNNNNTTDNLGAIHFGNFGDSTLSKILSGTSGANNSSYLTFSTSNSGSQAEAMRIDSSGNVGIGNTNPVGYSSRLVVDGGRLTIAAGNRMGFWEPANLGRFEINSPSYHALAFYTADGTTEVMRITSTGNVGIGTSSPVTKLDVVSASGSTYASIRRNSQSAGEVGLSLYGGTSGINWSLYQPTSSNDIRFYGNGADRLTINSAGNVGIGTTSPSSYNAVADNLVIGTTSGSNGLTIVAGTGNDGSIHFADGTSGADAYRGQIYYSHAGNYMVFSTNASEAMRIDSSGNVGIGTSNPAVQVQLGDGTATSQWIRTFGSVSNIYVGQNTSITHFGLTNASKILSTTENPFALGTTASQPIVFGTNNTERLRIDSSGNVGIGTSSPTGFSGYTSLDINNATSGAIIDLSQGDVMKGRLVATASTMAIETSSSVPIIFQPAGTEAMRINSAGNVGIGTSTPTEALTVVNGTNTTVAQFGGTSGGADPRGLTISTFSSAGGNDCGVDFNAAVNNTGYGAFTFSAGPNERMHINSIGNVNIGRGATHPDVTARLAVFNSGASESYTIRPGTNVSNQIDILSYNYGTGTYLPVRDVASSWIWFSGSAGERARIDTSGNLLVGRTSTITFSTNTTNGIVLSPSRIDISAASLCRISQLRDSTGIYDRFYNGASIVGSITGTTSATAYNTSSDQRLKENIADANDAGSKVDAIQVRQFDWKVDGSHQDYGMVAQELMTVAPEAVTQPEDSEEMMAVDYSKLVPMLIKEIQSLRNRVATLEGN